MFSGSDQRRSSVTLSCYQLHKVCYSGNPLQTLPGGAWSLKCMLPAPPRSSTIKTVGAATGVTPAVHTLAAGEDLPPQTKCCCLLSAHFLNVRAEHQEPKTLIFHCVSNRMLTLDFNNPLLFFLFLRPSWLQDQKRGLSPHPL